MSGQNPAAVLVDSTGSYIGVPGLPVVVTNSGPVYTTTTGSLPVALVPNPVTQSVWVQNQLSTVATTTGSLPVALVPNPTTQSIYVTNPVTLNPGATISTINNQGTLAVTGSQLTGSTYAGSPVVVGGTYQTGSYVKAIQVDASGSVYVTSSGSLPVALVPNPTTQSVWVQNQLSSVVTSTGSLPVALVPNPTTQSVWVQNQISAVATTTGSLPVALVPNPTTQSVFVSNQLSAVVTTTGSLAVALVPNPTTQSVFITNQVSDVVTTTGSLPVALVPNPTTQSVFVSNQVSAVATTTGSIPVQVVNTISGGVPVTSSFTKPLFNYPTSERATILSASIITTSGNVLVDGWPAWAEWYLISNMSGSVAGTNPSIQFWVDQVDPIDKITAITARTFGPVMTGSGVSNFQVVDTNSDTFRVGWIVSGTNPAFSGVNVTWIGRAAGSAIEGQAPVGTTVGDPPVLVAGVDDRSLVQYLHIDSAGNLHVIPQAVATTTTASLSPGFVHYGASAGVLTAVEATTYTEQTGSAKRSLKSTSANDNLSGSGAQKVQITYYDASGNGPFTETVSMNGTQAVATVNSNICFIERMVVTQVGSNGSNVGTLNLQTGASAGSVFGSIAVGTVVSAVGDNQTLWSHHYIGNFLTGSIVGLTCGTNGNQTAEVFLMTKNLTTGSNPLVFLSDILTVNNAANSVVRTYPAGIPVLGPARVTMYVDSNGSNTNFYGSFDWQEHY